MEQNTETQFDQIADFTERFINPKKLPLYHTDNFYMPNNTRVDGPARVEFSSERFGPICTREPSETPTIKVIHNRRNFSAGKQAIPLGGKGRYEVLILFQCKLAFTIFLTAVS